MSEDMTYCANWDCEVTRYRRNRANVKHRELMHAFKMILTKGNLKKVEQYLTFEKPTNGNLLATFYLRLKER